MTIHYPLLLSPALHVKVWGGRKLADLMHKPLPTDDPYGESWELHDTATVTNGDHAGRTLGDLLAEYGTDLIGTNNDPADGFPLLAKLLDANDWLSIQVHPNDEQAAVLEGEPRGKTEAWIVLHAEPNAQLLIGVQPGTDRDAMAQAIRDGVLEQHVVYANVQAGDVLLLAANTVHALGPGLLIYEIQQSSDTTYRLYDWGRVGLDGKPRQLHIEKGVQVANVDFLPQIIHTQNDNSPVVTMVESDYFKTNWHALSAGGGVETTISTSGKFHVLTCVNGSVTVSANDVDVTMGAGQTVLIPAAIRRYTLNGDGDLLRSWQPNGH
jgi:mannose-6-phosphate isomerase